jgi:hypothetical protein
MTKCSIHDRDALFEFYDYNNGATREWRIPCTTEMVHMPQGNYHDADQMMQTP